MAVIQSCKQAVSHAVTNAISAWAIGMNPVGGAVLGATEVLSGRMIYVLQRRAGFPVTSVSSTAFKTSTHVLRFLLNSILLYFAANAVGFAISFQAIVLIRGIGAIAGLGMSAMGTQINRYLQTANP